MLRVIGEELFDKLPSYRFEQLLTTIVDTLTSEQVKNVEDVLLRIAEESKDVKVRLGAKLLRIILEEPEESTNEEEK